MSDTEDLDGLEAAWMWFIDTVSTVVGTLIQVAEWIHTWPLPFKLIGGGAIAALILVGMMKR